MILGVHLRRTQFAWQIMQASRLQTSAIYVSCWFRHLHLSASAGVRPPRPRWATQPTINLKALT